ncbi:MAG: aminomethyl-transferring glycine dehydrogenase subunit GcvPA [Chloroflexi bacterium]|nr:aminomethyl-transferring glycine dehydrogenase subunit GcvPA [Chloroflexota bacterium]
MISTGNLSLGRCEIVPSPYIPNTDADRRAMLREIGVASVNELFRDVPEKFLDVPFRLPSPLSELELKAELKRMADANASLDDYACFLGAGFYRHFIPSVVGHITGRSEFYTAYTPYQAEVSQGTLQSIYEYQSLVCQLTGMEVSNAGMYDGSTAAAEAALMACRVTGKNKVDVLASVNPRYVDVMETYAGGQAISLHKLPSDFESLSADSACLVVQQPDFFGCLEDLASVAAKAHAAGALLVVIADPISLGMYRPPADYGADIVVAEGQSLGSPLNFGGPGLGIFTCRNQYLRQMPGRLAGRTMDSRGRPGYVLTMATREQHIRRERATSNICTNEALVSLAAAVYLAVMGKSGLRQVAELCYHKAHYAAAAIADLEGYSLVFPSPFFREFVVRCPVSPRRINEALYRQNIVGGLDLSETLPDSLLLCVTEMNTKSEIDRMVEVMKKVGAEK